MLIKLPESQILDVVSEKKKDHTIIISFANHAYLEVLLNWLVSIDLLGIKNYLVFSLDRKIYDYLLSKKIPTILLSVNDDLSNLWIVRVQVFRFLCRNNVDFIHTDIDAVWFRDPIDHYFVKQGSDIVFSQGTIWPPVVHQHWGFVLCCGLFYIRSNPETERLFMHWEESIQVSGDDQYALNVTLASLGLRMKVSDESTYHVTFQSDRFLCSREVMTGALPSLGLSVSLLPHHLFQRLPVPESNPYVKHFLSPKDSKAKMEMFRNTGCMFLECGWRGIEFDQGSLKNISAKRL